MQVTDPPHTVTPKHSLVFLHGFGETNRINKRFFTWLAKRGIRVLSPYVIAGKCRRELLDVLLDQTYHPQQIPTSVMAHSAGNLAFSGSSDWFADFASEIHRLIISHPPADIRPSRGKNMQRFLASGIRDLILAQRHISHKIRDLVEMAHWIADGDSFKETQRLAFHNVPSNILELHSHFKDRLHVIVDPDDIICPPSDLLSLLEKFEHQIHLLRLPYGHCPNTLRPMRFSKTVENILDGNLPFNLETTPEHGHIAVA